MSAKRGTDARGRKRLKAPAQTQGRVWAGLLRGLVPGEAKPCKVRYGGVEYEGEVIRAGAWRPELGMPLAGPHFRIIILSGHSEVSPDSIGDERIAVCIPARARRQVGEEREAYRTGEAARAGGGLGVEVERYASGAIVTRERLPFSPAQVFSDPDAERGLGLIVSSLLERAYRALWNKSLPYARPIEASLGEADQPQAVASQEAVLAAKLRELEAALDSARANIEALAQAMGSGLEPGAGAAQDRLSHLAASHGYLDFYGRALSEYATPQALANDMELWQRLRQVGELAPQALEVKRYLDGVVLRDSDEELAMDRMSIMGQLSLENMQANPSLWPSVKALFQWFKSRYGALYQGHHAAYHRELASLRLKLEDAEVEVEALSRLNSIAELGRAVGEVLAGEYHKLLAEVKPCPLAEEGKALVGKEPVCAACGLTLAAQPPSKRVEGFLNHLRQALRTQQRRLSSVAIQQILERQQEGRLDQLIKVIQTSDLSSLVKVIDDDLVAFLRDLLAEAGSHTEPCTALADLAEEFPVIEEGQIDGVAAELAAKLRAAFSQARKQNPSRHIRLALSPPGHPKRGAR